MHPFIPSLTTWQGHHDDGPKTLPQSLVEAAVVGKASCAVRRLDARLDGVEGKDENVDEEGGECARLCCGVFWYDANVLQYVGIQDQLRGYRIVRLLI